jgi:hypothetical protein
MRRRCIEDGCTALTTATRCPDHERARQRARNASRPGHRAAHRKARAQLLGVVSTGTARCARCGQPIAPADTWDADRTTTGWAPSHARCNRSAGARRDP